jgi:hypothetical protein
MRYSQATILDYSTDFNHCYLRLWKETLRMAFHVFPKLILALLAATAVLSADLWSCTGDSATMRTIGYYDTNYAGTECGEYYRIIDLCCRLVAIANIS